MAARRLVLPALCLALMSSAATGGEMDAASRSKDGVRVTPGQIVHLGVERVQVRPFGREVAAFGFVSYNEDRVTPVHSQFSGRATRLIAKPGDVVEGGSPLFELQSPEIVQLHNDLVAARLTVTKGEQRLVHLKRMLERQVGLLAAKATSQRDVELARSELETGEAELVAARGALAATRSRLELMMGITAAERERIERAGSIDQVVTVKAPIGGTITARKVGAGQFVRNDSSEPLYAIADLSTMWIKMSIPESLIAGIEVGNAVEVTVSALPGRLFKGQVAAVDAILDKSTRRVIVRTEVPNRDGLLKAEMYATGRILASKETPSPSIPLSAVVREGTATSAWVLVEDRQFVRRVIRIGTEKGGYVQVLGGLKAGENVVVRGAIFLDNEWRQ